MKIVYLAFATLVISAVLLSGCLGSNERLAVELEAMRSIGGDYYARAYVKNIGDSPVNIKVGMLIFDAGGEGMQSLSIKKDGAKLKLDPRETDHFNFNTVGWTNAILEKQRERGAPYIVLHLGFYNSDGQKIGKGEYKATLPAFESLPVYDELSGAEPRGQKLDLVFLPTGK